MVQFSRLMRCIFVITLKDHLKEQRKETNVEFYQLNERLVHHVRFVLTDISKRKYRKNTVIFKKDKFFTALSIKLYDNKHEYPVIKTAR